MKKLFTLALVILGFSATSFGQTNTATATTTATITTPLTISKTMDMNFGTVTASGVAGVVKLDYNDGRSVTGGVTTIAGSAAQKTAVFTVSGTDNSTFSITIPVAPIIMTGTSLGMTVSNFLCDASSPSALVAGTKVIKVKADLNVPASATAGTYTNASGLSVTVNYN